LLICPHQSFEHQDLSLVLGFVIDQMMKNPAQSDLGSGPVLFVPTVKLIQIFIGKPFQHFKTNLADPVYLINAEAG
jgi:hypothetical protein